MGAEIQKYMQILKLPRGPFDNELLQSRHAQIHPRLKHKLQVMAEWTYSELALCEKMCLYHVTHLVLTVTSDYFQR